MKKKQKRREAQYAGLKARLGITECEALAQLGKPHGYSLSAMGRDDYRKRGIIFFRLSVEAWNPVFSRTPIGHHIPSARFDPKEKWED